MTKGLIVLVVLVVIVLVLFDSTWECAINWWPRTRR